MNSSIRAFFPALSRMYREKPLIFLDGPAGVQVPEMVIEAIAEYYRKSNANTHGQFITTQETDEVMHDCRESLAIFLGAESARNISLGQNMTTLNFALSLAMGRYLQAGDEILITQLDHESNRGPWLALRRQGVVVREVRLRENGTLDYEDFAHKINEKTRLVAMGLASNIFGTINEVSLIRRLTHQVGAWLLLDAVHYAPHFTIDVQDLDCDFLLCSAYKFYGPHVGILYCKTGLLDRLDPNRLRTTEQQAPYSIETGTLNHAAIAGVLAAVQFLASLGLGTDLREKLVHAFQKIVQHERALAQGLYEGLADIPGIRVIGPDFNTAQRAPTLSFVMEGKTPTAVCQALAVENICAWDGHFYAIKATEVLGLAPLGGVTRMGISLYTMQEEVDFTLEVLRKMRSNY